MKLFDATGWLSADEVCQVLGFGKRSVRYHCNKGNLERSKTNNGVRYKINWAYFGERDGVSGNGLSAVSGKLPDVSGKAEVPEADNLPKSLRAVGGSSVSVSFPAAKPEVLPEKLFESVPLEAHKLVLEKFSDLSDRNALLSGENSELRTKVGLLDERVAQLNDTISDNRRKLFESERSGRLLLAGALVFLLTTLALLARIL
ncbi:MAG: hypothetical protein KDD44_08580 [Bdellovibrionales bacterium]|nr:hypothetical protein [Bdellovibrionales bacterium]